MSCMLGSQVVKLPEGAGFVVNFHFGKTFRSSSHTFVVRPDRECPHICPVRAMGEYSGAAAAIGWDLAQGYLFPPVNEDGSSGTGTLKAAHMTASLQAYLRRAEVPPPDATTLYTMHSFRVGGAVSRSLAGTTVADIMSLVRWKCAGVGQTYIGATLPSHGEKRKRESHEQAVHGRERAAHITRICETVRSFPPKRPLRHDLSRSLKRTSMGVKVPKKQRGSRRAR